MKKELIAGEYALLALLAMILFRTREKEELIVEGLVLTRVLAALTACRTRTRVMLIAEALALLALEERGA